MSAIPLPLRVRVPPTTGGALAGAVVAGVVLWALLEPAGGRYVVDVVALWAAVLCAGIAGFAAVAGSGAPPDVTTRLVRVLAVTAVAAALLSVAFAVMTTAGSGLRGLGDPLARRDVLRGGDYAAALTRCAGLVGVVIAGSLRRRAARRVAGASAALVVVASFALTGHARSSGHVLLSGALTTLHVASAAMWLGGLALLALAMRSNTSVADRTAAARTTARVMTTVVALLLTAGVALAALDLSSPAALLRTAYGQVLLVKVGLVLAVLVVSAANHLRVVPATATGARDAERVLRMNVAVEQIGLAAVVVVTALLSQQNPGA